MARTKKLILQSFSTLNMQSNLIFDLAIAIFSIGTHEGPCNLRMETRVKVRY